MRFRNLKTHLRHLPLYRPFGLPADPNRVAVFTFPRFLESLSRLLAEKPHLKPACVVLIASPEEGEYCPPEISLIYKDKTKIIPVIDRKTYYAKKHIERLLTIVYVPEGTDHQWTQTLKHAMSTGYFCIPRKANLVTWAWPEDIDFYINYNDKLEYIYSLLQDEASRECMAGRVKAFLTQNNAYTPIALHPQYFHPYVQPHAGDTVIDGGIGGNSDVINRLRRAVGRAGRIFSFDPIPQFVADARTMLTEADNVKIIEAGLGAVNGTTIFIDFGDASRQIPHLHGKKIDVEKNKKIECNIVSIDNFVSEYSIDKINFIKLDVEGGELDVLNGAVSVICEQKPQLAISVYHKPTDIWELPEFIARLCPSYKFWMGHHSMVNTETVLYASI